MDSGEFAALDTVQHGLAVRRIAEARMLIHSSRCAQEAPRTVWSRLKARSHGRRRRWRAALARAIAVKYFTTLIYRYRGASTLGSDSHARAWVPRRYCWSRDWTRQWHSVCTAHGQFGGDCRELQTGKPHPTYGNKFTACLHRLRARQRHAPNRIGVIGALPTDAVQSRGAAANLWLWPIQSVRARVLRTLR